MRVGGDGWDEWGWEHGLVKPKFNHTTILFPLFAVFLDINKFFIFVKYHQIRRVLI